LTAWKILISTDLTHELWACTYFTRRHHHAATDGIERVRGNTGTSGDSPAEHEGSEEVVFEGTGEEDGLDRVVHAEV